MQSIAAVEKQQDPVKRLRAAARLASEAAIAVDEARTLRDHAALLLIQPYTQAMEDYEAGLAKADAAEAAGQITPAEHAVLEARLHADKRIAMSKVPYKPVDVERKVGVARQLFVRIRHNGPSRSALPPMDNPEKVAVKAAKDRQKYLEVGEAARTIRDAAIREVMDPTSGWAQDPKTKGPLANFEVCEITGLTSARVAQINPQLAARAAG